VRIDEVPPENGIVAYDSLTVAFEDSPAFHAWLAALEARHLRDLRVPEVTRALRALSLAYVERRGPALDRTLDSAGKRAAFALFYAPLHLLTVDRIVRALGREADPPGSILDIGCGTGVAGAAWALAAGGRTRVNGIDRHPWAIEEARWNYHTLQVDGHARTGDISHLRPVAPHTAVIAAYVLNELPDHTRDSVLSRLSDACGRGAELLIVEPISRRVAPWWDRLTRRFVEAGARTDEWRFEVDLPGPLRVFDRAAHLDHRELTARSLYCSGADAGSGVR
jgi:2-polyprenyl-3-methyl-5-hydroxy-6-metoxy-1,4-benzoquinol methylase